MTDGELLVARASYRYVPARLVSTPAGKTADLQWDGLSLNMFLPQQSDWKNAIFRLDHSSLELDRFHTTLFSGHADEQLLHGLLSVVFWGFASGAKGRHTGGRALKRVMQLRDGHTRSEPQRKAEIIEHLRSVRAHIRKKNPDAALLQAMQIKFLGFSFASKLVMFMAPKRTAVYDSVIGQRLQTYPNPVVKELAMDIRRTTNKTTLQSRAAIYRQWCHWCAEKATALNTRKLQWRDWNDKMHAWRAVDVERAFFALGR